MNQTLASEVEGRIERTMKANNLTRSKAIDYAIVVAEEGLEMAMMDDMESYVQSYQERITYLKTLKKKEVKVVEITETELRGLIFWATVGIGNSNGGSYRSIIHFIKNHSKLMNCRMRYKNLEFGNRLKESVK